MALPRPIACCPHVLEKGIALYTPAQRRVSVFRIGVDLSVGCRAYAAWTLWLLGYPQQALARIQEALALAHELAHPYSLGWAWVGAAIISQFRRDVSAVYEQTETAVTLSTEQGFPLWEAGGMSVRGWALAMQGKQDEARALLAPVYGWFTEGFDTADLQEAKVLREGLA